MTSPFSDPGTGGTKLPLANLLGSLLLVDVHALETDIPTTFGAADAVRCDVAVLDGVHKAERYDDTLVFPRVLLGQLRGKVGEKVLGRLTQGTAKPGQSPPWTLSPATDADREVGTKYLAYVASQQPVASVPAPSAGPSRAAFSDEEPFVRDATTTDI